MMRYSSMLLSIFVIIFAVSCSGQNVEPKNNASQPSRATKVQPKNQQKTVPAAKKPDGYVPGEILIKFNDGINTQVIKAIQTEFHLATMRLVKPNLYLMKILDGASVEHVIERLQNYKEVRFAEPNYIRGAH